MKKGRRVKVSWTEQHEVVFMTILEDDQEIIQEAMEGDDDNTCVGCENHYVENWVDEVPWECEDCGSKGTLKTTTGLPEKLVFTKEQCPVCTGEIPGRLEGRVREDDTT